MSRVVDTYALQIIAGDDTPSGSTLWMWAALPAFVAEAEENLTDLLPDGYSVRITRWNEEREAANR